MNYVRPIEAKKMLGVSDVILRKWAKEGTIECIRVGTHRRYNIEKILSKRGLSENKGRKICYARVSSNGQKADLEEQVRYLKNRFPEHEIIKDIGSGLNFKRKGFKAVLESAIKGDISEIVVAYRDRLCRFGFQLVEWIITSFKGEIVVLNEETDSPQEELVKDLISIITVFSSRIYGLRKYKNKIREQIKVSEDTTITNKRTEGKTDTSKKSTSMVL
jgi:predicted site-specific integrase-resolvase